MGNVISKWREITGSESLEDYLAGHFGDKTKFKVSRKRHDTVQRRWPGAMTAAKCFVLQGRFRISFANEQFEMMEGDYCELPGGRYEFEILGDSECAYVMVYPLPDRLSGEWQTPKVHQKPPPKS